MGKKPNFRCEICGKEVYRSPNKPPKHITCSKECHKELNKRLNQVLVKCLYCGKKFYRKKSRCNGPIYCDNVCYKNANPDLDTKLIIEYHNKGMYDKDIADLLGCTRSAVTAQLNKLGINGRRSKINDILLRKRISESNRGKRIGKNNHNFKGNRLYTDMARGIFNSISKMYMLKHDYTCEKCHKRGGSLNTHHIKHFHIIVEEFVELYKDILTKENFSEKILNYPDFIDENNLILLCEECHKKEHRK